MKLSITILLGLAGALCSAPPLAAQTLATWEAPIRVAALDGALAKSAGCDGCPDAGAHSATRLTGDGYAEFVPAAGERIIAGLGTDLTAATASSTIDFAFSLWPDGGWEVRERGAYRTEGTSATGDRFRVAIESGGVVYRRNGAIVYRSAVPPSYPLVLDVTLYSTAAALSGATVAAAAVPVVDFPPVTTVLGPPQFTVTGPYQAVTDRMTYARPPLPVMGPAGSTVADPVFLSAITRITDGSTRPDAQNRSYRTPSNTHQNTWSATGSRFYVVSSDGSVLPYTFDAATGTAQRIEPTATGAGGLILSFYIEPQFSYVRESIIYGSYSGPGGASLRTIDQYDFTTRSYSRLLDLDALAPGLANTYIGGLASSSGSTERVLAFFGGARQDLHHYAVVFDATNPQNRQVLDSTASTLNGSPAGVTLNFSLHHATIDRTGRYVMLYSTSADQSGPRKAPYSVLWDTQTNVFTEMPVSSLPYGHDTFGYGVWVNKDCCTSTSYDAGQWQFRSLASPLLTRDVIRTVLSPKEVYMSDHQTWNNARPDNSAPFISATYRHGTDLSPFRAWDEEIIAVQADAAPGAEPTVWRFAHHRSDVTNDLNAAGTSFWYMPRANVSSDGRWVLFTSNWEKTLGVDPTGEPGGGARQDVFLVALKSSAPVQYNSVVPPVRITSPRTIPDATAGSFYTYAVQAAHVQGIARWELAGGEMPPGLRLDAATGVIWGTCLTPGSWSYNARIKDAGADDTLTLTLTVR